MSPSGRSKFLITGQNELNDGEKVTETEMNEDKSKATLANI
jgi:hypothetical protein